MNCYFNASKIRRNVILFCFNDNSFPIINNNNNCFLLKIIRVNGGRIFTKIEMNKLSF